MPFGPTRPPGLSTATSEAELAHGRHVGEALRPGGGEDRQQPQLAGHDHRRPARGLRGEVDLAAQQGAHRVGRAAIGRVRPGEALRHAEALHGEMLGRADAQRAPVQLAGIGLGIGQQLGQRLPRRVGAHHHAHDEAGDLQDVGEVLDRIVLELRVEQRLAQHAHVHLADRVAVRLGVLQRERAQHAGGPALVLDDDRLAELLRDRLGQDAEAGIGRPAGGPRDDQPDRPVGKARLGARRARGRERQDGGSAEGGPSRYSPARYSPRRVIPWRVIPRRVMSFMFSSSPFCGPHHGRTGRARPPQKAAAASEGGLEAWLQAARRRGRASPR